MSLADRESQVLKALVSIVDSVLHDFDVVELLTHLTERCGELLDIASAGLLLAGPGGQLHLMAATSHRTRDLELFQLRRDEGPCVDCHASGEAVSVADLRVESGRWPQFVPAALEAGFASVHAIPMRAAGTVIGALGLFGTAVGALNMADKLVGTSLAHVATVAILQEQALLPETLVTHLQKALTSRTLVQQAEGFLREQLDLPIEAAFSLLRRYAATHDEHLTNVARQIVSRPDTRPMIVTAMTDMLTEPAPVRRR